MPFIGLLIACFKDVGKAERFLISPHPMLDLRCPVECAMQSEAANAQAIAIRMGKGLPGEWGFKLCTRSETSDFWFQDGAAPGPEAIVKPTAHRGAAGTHAEGTIYVPPSVLSRTMD